MPKKKTTSKRKPSLTQIRKILREAAFNPRDVGPLSIIADVGDSNYYIMRAIEELMKVKGPAEKFRMIQAIQLVALAVADA